MSLLKKGQGMGSSPPPPLLAPIIPVGASPVLLWPSGPSHVSSPCAFPRLSDGWCFLACWLCSQLRWLLVFPVYLHRSRSFSYC